MQSVYQIPGGLLESHIARLQVSPAVQSCRSNLHSLLFLSGLRVAFFYYRAANAGNEFFTNWAPSHHLDDGLDPTARNCLTSLMRDARSRLIRECAKLIYPDGAPNPNWLAVSLAFANVFENSNKTVSAWISCGDSEQNKLRLSCGMGVVALWSPKTVGFVHDLMGHPFSFDEDVASALRSFELTPDTVLPEL